MRRLLILITLAVGCVSEVPVTYTPGTCDDCDAVCGDGLVSGGEACDDGVNDGAYGGCATDCSVLAARCGDGKVDDGEVCDDGVNDDGYAGCASDCLSVGPVCGDGAVDGPELCDDGVNDGAYGGCTSACALAPRCGDGLLDAAVERCDDGANDGRPGGCSAGCAFVPESVVISEIMYNPVGRDALLERHEFIELANPTPREVRLDGWRLNGVGHVFASGDIIPPHGFFVLAKDDGAFTSVYGDVTPRASGYPGVLSNGGEELTLLRDDGSVSDRVIYDDRAPWPTGADGVGADERWIANFDDASVRFSGRSLERVNLDAPSTLAENWAASSLRDGAGNGPTPGAVNGANALELKDIVSAFTVTTTAGLSTISATDEVEVQIDVTTSGSIERPVIEYFVDDVATSDEATAVVSLIDGRATLPAQPERSVVRWRVLADRGDDLEVIEPRRGAPNAWNAYYVEAPHDEPTPTYELFIAPSDWTQMWTNIAAGRVQGCVVNPTWQDTVPAVFVYEGKVYDVQVRHQGSRYQRRNGPDVANWPFPGPSDPVPMKVLSWKIEFPDYAPFEGRKSILLNKLQQACSGLYQGVGFNLFREIGVPTPDVAYRRFFINGGFYNYALQLDHMANDALERHEERRSASTGEGMRSTGALFKAKGIHNEEGPFESGDGGLIPEGCGYTSTERYEHTFSKKTQKWADSTTLIALIEDLDLARSGTDDDLRAYMEAHWDVDTMLRYVAVMNWLAPWDDVFHNYYVYQDGESGLWMLMPWDLDRTFGDNVGNRTDTSLFVGREGDVDNRSGRTQFFKDAILRAYPDAYLGAVRELNDTLLTPDSMLARIDAWRATADPADAASSIAGAQCDYDAQADRTRTWVQARHAFVQAAVNP